MAAFAANSEGTTCAHYLRKVSHRFVSVRQKLTVRKTIPTAAKNAANCREIRSFATFTKD
jgi:hypothetical protein